MVTVATAAAPIATLTAPARVLRVARLPEDGALLTSGDDGDDEWIGAVAAGRILGIDRTGVHRMDRSALPYREVGTGVKRGLTRRYRRADVEALRDERDERDGSATDRRLTDHDRRISELERRLSEHERDHNA